MHAACLPACGLWITVRITDCMRIVRPGRITGLRINLRGAGIWKCPDLSDSEVRVSTAYRKVRVSGAFRKCAFRALKCGAFRNCVWNCVFADSTVQRVTQGYDLPPGSGRSEKCTSGALRARFERVSKTLRALCHRGVSLLGSSWWSLGFQLCPSINNSGVLIWSTE